MKILVFTEGTIIMHEGAHNLLREQIVKQVRDDRDPSLRDWASYIPIGNSVQKLNGWSSQGAQIMYLTSRTTIVEVETVDNVLKKHHFPRGPLLHRKNNEEYKDVAEKTKPNIIIEDDCESIGGESQMTYTHISPQLKHKITLVAVKEFGGIDHLPDSINALAVPDTLRLKTGKTGHKARQSNFNSGRPA